MFFHLSYSSTYLLDLKHTSVPIYIASGILKQYKTKTNTKFQKFQESSELKSYKLFTVFGIPVKVHSTLLFLFPVMVYYLGKGTGLQDFLPINHYLFITLMMLFGYISILLHELGHSVVGIWRGYRIKEIVLLPIGGVAKISHMTTSHKDELLVAAAGPLVSLILSATFGGLAFLCAFLRLRGLYLFTSLLAYLNLAWTIFNLIPAFPMDGGRILRASLTPKIGRIKATRIAATIGQTLAAMFGAYSLMQRPPHLFHVFLAIYIYRAAGAEYKILLLHEAYNARFGWNANPTPSAPQNVDNNITVGPPPYQESLATKNVANSFNNIKDKLKNAFTSK